MRENNKALSQGVKEVVENAEVRERLMRVWCLRITTMHNCWWAAREKESLGTSAISFIAFASMILSSMELSMALCLMKTAILWFPMFSAVAILTLSTVCWGIWGLRIYCSPRFSMAYRKPSFSFLRSAKTPSAIAWTRYASMALTWGLQFNWKSTLESWNFSQISSHI